MVDGVEAGRAEERALSGEGELGVGVEFRAVGAGVEVVERFDVASVAVEIHD